MGVGRALLGFVAAALALAAPAAQAWSWFVHRQVAELAERQLDAPTRAAALALLGEGQHLADVAAWADEQRDDPGYAWSARLHFVNFADAGCRYRPERDCPDGACVVGAIEGFRADLANAALPDALRAEALRFLVHLVADVHQPLHAGFARDKGGNTHQVRIDGQGSNLHRVWDNDLPARLGRDPEEALRSLGEAPLPPAGALEPSVWAEESCRIVASEGFYPRRRRVDEAYLVQQLPVVRARIRLAAARLAALLEDALGPPH